MDLKSFRQYMIFAALFGSLYLYIQAFKIFNTKETAGVSELAYVITLISATAWLTYSFMANDIVIRVSAISGIIGSILVLYAILKYRNNHVEKNIDFDDDNRDPAEIIYAYTDCTESNPWLIALNDTTKVITCEEMLPKCFCRR